jgi:hypothetical protein
MIGSHLCLLAEGSSVLGPYSGLDPVMQLSSFPAAAPLNYERTQLAKCMIPSANGVRGL